MPRRTGIEGAWEKSALRPGFRPNPPVSLYFPAVYAVFRVLSKASPKPMKMQPVA